MIKIEVERKAMNGKKGYVIKGFKALLLPQLPKEYVVGHPCLWVSCIEFPDVGSYRALHIESEMNKFPTELAGKSGQYDFDDCRGPLFSEIDLRVGTWVCEETWRRICETVNEAGNRLKKIRNEQRKLAALNEELSKTWNGTKVYKW